MYIPLQFLLGLFTFQSAAVLYLSSEIYFHKSEVTTIKIHICVLFLGDA